MHEGHRKRMLEKLNIAGDSLSEHELLEILLFNAYPRINTNSIAHELLDTFGNLDGIFSADMNALMQVKNVGERCAGYLNVLGRILNLSKISENPMPVLFNFYDFKNYLTKRYSISKTEEFVIFFLNKRHKVINEWKCTNDNDSMVMLDFKMITKLISLNKPYSAVVAHNHISGNPNPTKNDDKATGGLAMLFSLNNVQFYDHIIISDKKVFSYHLSGKLKEITENYNIHNIANNLTDGGKQ